MLTSGFIKLYRDLRGSRFWPMHGQRFSQFEALVDLMMDARFKPGVVMRGGVSIHVPVAGVLTTQVELARRWRWDRKTVAKFLLELIKRRIACIVTKRGVDKGYTLVTFLKLKDFEAPEIDDLPIEKPEEIPAEIPIGSPSDPHTIRRERIEQVGKVVEYDGLSELEEAGRGGDYIELSTGLQESSFLMRMTRETLLNVARVKWAFGKNSTVREHRHPDNESQENQRPEIVRPWR